MQSTISVPITIVRLCGISLASAPITDVVLWAVGLALVPISGLNQCRQQSVPESRTGKVIHDEWIYES